MQRRGCNSTDPFLGRVNGVPDGIVALVVVKFGPEALEQPLTFGDVGLGLPAMHRCPSASVDPHPGFKALPVCIRVVAGPLFPRVGLD
jgi:hypothetical protein